MKKFFILIVVAFSFTSCIKSLLNSIKDYKTFYTEEQNLIIENPKAFYNVGDTLKMRYVFKNKFIGKTGKYEINDNYYTDIHKDFPELEQELFTFTYRTIDNRFIKDRQEVITYKEVLLYNKEQNTYTSEPIFLLLKKEGTYQIGDSNFFEVNIASVSNIKNNKDNLSSLGIGINGKNSIIKVVP